MNSAQSARGNSKWSPSHQNPSTSGSAADLATKNSSSRAVKDISLVDGLRLTIKLHVVLGETQWLRMTLEDELNMMEVTVDCPILCTTPQKRYHLEEATVVGMRRLMDAAFEAGLISASPGEWMTPWKTPLTGQVAPMPMPSEDDSSLSSIDLELP